MGIYNSKGFEVFTIGEKPEYSYGISKLVRWIEKFGREQVAPVIGMLRDKDKEKIMTTSSSKEPIQYVIEEVKEQEELDR